MPITDEKTRAKVRLTASHTPQMRKLAEINKRPLTSEVDVAIEQHLESNRKALKAGPKLKQP